MTGASVNLSIGLLAIGVVLLLGIPNMVQDYFSPCGFNPLCALGRGAQWFALAAVGFLLVLVGLGLLLFGPKETAGFARRGGGFAVGAGRRGASFAVSKGRSIAARRGKR